jgi:hypothetical protein
MGAYCDNCVITARTTMTNQLLQRPGKLALTLSLLLPLLVGCTTTQAVEPPPYRGAATQASFSEAQLDSLLAPIALYPDTVLSHVLIASTYPLEVVEADRWARNNTRHKGDDAVNAVDSKDWDPSVKALAAFPDILKRMSDDLDWTQQLGDAFLADEERVMDSIQNLRNRAYNSGNLDKVEHVRVIREERTIVIEPSVERVVYVPAYDTRVVYGNWWWPDYPPVYWNYPSSYVFVSGFYWGPRVYLGPRFYFSGVHWHQRRVVVVDHHHHHRFYDSRSVVRYNNARHWHHNPVHRRGVAYYDNHTRARFNSPRESYRDAREYRTNLRDGSQLAPNRARDQRQGRDQQFQQQLERRQAGPMGGNDARARIYGEKNGNQERAQLLRERMNTRSNDPQTPRTRQSDNQPAVRDNQPRARDNQVERQPQSERREERRENRVEQPANTTQPVNRAQRPDYRVQPGQNTTQERQRIYRTEQPRQSQPNRQPETTPNRIERIQTPRAQPIERSQPRIQNTERQMQRIDRGGGGDNRASVRGERER